MAKQQAQKVSENKNIKINPRSKPIKKEAKKAHEIQKQKWNKNKLTIGDYFSCH